MIDAQMMKEHVFIASAFRRLTEFPELATNRATTVLLLEDSLQLLHRDRITSSQVGASHLVAT
jgi:hypothetical protein